MEELKKVKRVISKLIPDAPHQMVLVLDGNTGQNGIAQVLVQDAQERKLDRDCFNEAYLMHTSTSPQYAIIA